MMDSMESDRSIVNDHHDAVVEAMAVLNEPDLIVCSQRWADSLTKYLLIKASGATVEDTGAYGAEVVVHDAISGAVVIEQTGMWVKEV